MHEVAERLGRMIEAELLQQLMPTTNVVPIDPNNALTSRKMRAMMQQLNMPPPSMRLRLVPSHIWNTYGMWSPGITSADRWRMWCRKEATEKRLERNPTHDAMPSDYIKMPEFDWTGRIQGQVILCKGERAYYALLAFNN